MDGQGSHHPTGDLSGPTSTMSPMSTFVPRDPNWASRVDEIFSSAPFVRHLGIELEQASPGRCASRMRLAPEHRQQDGLVHAGVQTTLADHTAGAAAGSLMEAGQIVLSIEFKIHLLRGARGSELRCVAEVLKPGSMVAVVEAEVFAGDGEPERWTLTSKLIATMAYRPR